MTARVDHQAPALAGRDETLTSDMRAVVQSAHLCFAATVTPGGMPNVSPKGTVRVWDHAHLYFLDLASPGTRANVAHAPWMELNVVDQTSRRGYRFFGRAALHGPGSPVYDEATARVVAEEGHAYDAAAVVLLAVERAAPLVSPGYQHVPDEAAMRRAWYARRSALDREFEAYLGAERAARARGERER